MSISQEMIDQVITRAAQAVISADETVGMAYASGTFTKDVLRICEAKLKVNENAITAPSSPALAASSTIASITEETSSPATSSSSVPVMEEESSGSSSSSSSPPINPNSITTKITDDEEISIITILTNKLNADEHVFQAAQKAATNARALQQLIKQLLLPEHVNKMLHPIQE